MSSEIAMKHQYKTSILINNYNYAQYIESALQSVFAQTIPFDEIIVVDDGSTDNSIEVIDACIKNQPNATLVAKSNEGQLSCINEGFIKSTGDLIFFLDADDEYTARYLEKTLRFYQQNQECDYLFTAVQEFGHREETKIYCEKYCPKTGKIGYSLFRTLYGKEVIGVPTSTISVKREFLDKILPFENYSDWKVCADDCIAIGSSLAGALKYTLPEPLVRYRVHGKNHWYGKNINKKERYQKRLITNRLIQSISKNMDLDGEIGNLIMAEYNSIPDPTYNLAKFYINLSMNSQIYPLKKSMNRKKILKDYFKKRIKQFIKILRV